MKKLLFILLPALAFGYVQNIDSLSTQYVKIYGPAGTGGKVKDTLIKNAIVKTDANGFFQKATQVKDTNYDALAKLDTLGLGDSLKRRWDSTHTKQVISDSLHKVKIDSAALADSAKSVYHGVVMDTAQKSYHAVISDSATGAVRAAKLTTARTIGGVSFDGTANIVPDTCKRSGTSAVADAWTHGVTANYVPYANAATTMMASPIKIGSSTTAVQIFKGNGTTNVLTVDTTSSIVNIGSVTGGSCATINATEGPELAPALEAANWTCTDGWSAGAGQLVKIAGVGNGYATPSGAFPVVAGRIYKVVVTFSANNGVTSSFYSTIGNSAVHEPMTLVTTYTDYTIATNTNKLVINGYPATVGIITAVSVKELAENTGVLTNYGKMRIVGLWSLTGGNLINFSSQGACGIGAAASNAGYMLTVGGNMSATQTCYAQAFTYGGHSWLYMNEDYYVSSFRNSTSQSIVRIYNTYTNSSNYERMSLTGVSGASVNLTAESAGTGSANLNIILTPKGTGYTILNGDVGICLTTVESKLHIAAGSAVANTAPLQFTSGAVETVPRAGVMEFLTDTLYFTPTTGPKRKKILLSNSLNLTTIDTIKGFHSNMSAYSISGTDSTGNLKVNGNAGFNGYNWNIKSNYTDINWGLGVYNSGAAYYTKLIYAPDLSTDRRSGIYAGGTYTGWVAYGDQNKNFIIVNKTIASDTIKAPNFNVTGVYNKNGVPWVPDTCVRTSTCRLADSTAKVPKNYTANWWTFDSTYSRTWYSACSISGMDSTTGNVKIGAIGGGLHIKTGTNARIGTATLVGGVIAVANTSVTANTRVFLSCATAIGTQGFLSYTQINGTSFTINSSAGAADNSIINWLLVESIP